MQFNFFFKKGFYQFHGRFSLKIYRRVVGFTFFGGAPAGDPGLLAGEI